MKPINLKISAFGPFKNEITINFNKLNKNKIFLITGDTGSGKTTIFDAICYCLYNDTSGKNRTVESLRSDYADNKTNTFVELTFEHKNKVYTIYRSPSYLKEGRKTKTIPEAILKYNDNIIEGVTKVNDEINKILGIDVKQFKQISMLAQGEFLNLLLASSDERSKIFRRIFDTTIYNKISEELKSRFLKIKKTADESKIRLDNEIEHIKWDNDIDKSSLLISELLCELKTLIDNDTKIYNKIKSENECLISKKEELNNLITLSKIDNDNITKLNEMKLELNKLLDLKTKYDELKKDIEINKILIPINNNLLKTNNELNDLKRNNKLLTNSIIKIKKNLDKSELEYSKINYYKEELNKYNIIYEKLKENIEIENNINENEEFIKNQKIENLNGLEDQKEELLAIITNDKSEVLLSQALIKEKEIISKIDNNNNKLNEITSLEKELNILKNNANKYIIEVEKSTIEYSELEKNFLMNQAGLLGQLIEDSKPCMVCGSLEHPNIAQLNNSYVTKNELDKFKIKLDKCIDNRNKYINKIDVIKTKISEKNKDKVIEELKELKNINLNIDNLKNSKKLNDSNKIKLEKISNKIENLKKIQKEIDIKKANIILLKKSLFQSEYIISEVNDKISYYKNLIENTTNNYNDLINKFNILTNEIKLNEIQNDKKNNELNDIKKEINDINYNKEIFTIKKCKELENEYFIFYEKYNKYNTIVNELMKLTKNKKILNVSIYEQEYNEIQELINVNLNNETLIRLKNNIEIYNNISKLYSKDKQILKQYNIYKKLSDTANGTIVGKNKILFEQYVQSSYFNEIIKKSNYRLDIMTSGRYELLKKINNYNLKDKVGLDLSILDNYTGKIRDVKSLSGGESFKAALSLALGLSDTIQNYAGGIVIDTMFIDEGFGSLDNDSLEQALRTLDELSSGNCLIGIISHVTELKQRIDKKIIVSKSNQGSSIKIEL